MTNEMAYQKTSKYGVYHFELFSLMNAWPMSLYFWCYQFDCY